jgi:CubicO group peptidase (beta-lactamase class C family)
MTNEHARGGLSRRTLLTGALGVGAGLALRDPLARSVAALGDATGMTGVASAAITPSTTPLLDGITAWVESIKDLVPGCMVAAIDLRAGTAGTYTTGFYDLANQKPFVPSTVALIDSVTKQFTTTMLAQAVSGGLGRSGPMKVDDKIHKYIEPYLAQYSLTVPKITGDITLQQLADYTSGFYERPFNEGNNPPAYTLQEFATWLSEVQGVGKDQAGEGLAVKPGSAYYYSDVACDLLGFILADQLVLTGTGTPLYEPLLAKMLTGPDVLDMPDTVIYPPDPSRVAIGYLYDKEPPNPTFKLATKVNAPPVFGGGGGNLRSTANDMLKLLRALVAPPATQFLDQAIPLTSKVWFPGPGGVTGLGWDPVKEGEAMVFLKNGGGSAGCTAELGYSPQTQRALFFVANVGFASSQTHVAEEFTSLLTQISPVPPTTTTSTTTTTTSPVASPATPVAASPTLAG